MANIKVKIDYPIGDGAKLKFRTPCESTSVEGLVVTYPIKDGVGYAVKNFTFVDAHGSELSGVGNVFTSDVMIEVLLDVTHGKAYIKNADTNSYIEDIKATVKRMDEERQAIFTEAGKSIKECNDATKDANEAAKTLNLSAEEIRSSGFVESLKEQNEGKKFTFWVGTKEEYNQITEKKTNCFYLITDDNAMEEIATLRDDVEKLSDECSKLRVEIKWLKADATEIYVGDAVGMLSTQSAEGMGSFTGFAFVACNSSGGDEVEVVFNEVNHTVGTHDVYDAETTIGEDTYSMSITDQGNSMGNEGVYIECYLYKNGDGCYFNRLYGIY
jgi:hypothetical protein